MNKEMIMGATALLLVSLLSACKDPAPVPPPATNTEFSAKLNAFSQSPFKGTWETGDFIGVACVKDGKIITETIKAGQISARNCSLSTAMHCLHFQQTIPRSLMPSLLAIRENLFPSLS